MSKYCFIIPCYQHSSTLGQILKKLEAFKLKIFIVNDGSDPANSEALQKIASASDLVELIHHEHNQGKGAAVSTGLQKAFQQGFSHGIQIDSDGQHDLSKVQELIDLSVQHPKDLISGQPQYDESVPQSRLYARYATHIWVWIETLSFQIKDSMCGFRVYPLEATTGILNRNQVGKRMDFDIEIMVRLFWGGVRIRQIPVLVIYPENGISHFDVVKDNVRISKMHTKLVFGMLWRFPKLLLRSLRAAVTASSPEPRQWHKIEEFGSVLGIRILLFFYRLTGRKVLNLILYPLSFYYSLTSQNAKRASRDFQRILQEYTEGQAKSFSTFAHVYSFAKAAMDKFSVWFGDIRYEDLLKSDVEELLEICNSEQGAFFITSHFGNIEICRALGRFSKVKFNALVYYENAKRFNSYLSQINQDSNLNLISVQNVGPEISIILKDKVDNKEWVFMMGDRLSIQDQKRSVSVRLLGQKADLPEGPFIMGYLLDVPIYVIHCYREGPQFRIKLKQVTPNVERNRNHRQAFIQQVAEQYAMELETVILQDPLQWYNFFDFWGTQNEK